MPNVKTKLNLCFNNLPPLGLCNGCGLCVAVCPRKCLSVKLRNDGRLVRNLTNKEQESGKCHLCSSVCPSYGWAFDHLPKLPKAEYSDRWFASYTAFAAEPEIRSLGASGGVTTALLGYLMNEGIIDGALVVSPHRKYVGLGEGFIARSKADLINSAGSFYGPVTMENGIREILEVNGAYAVVGLPCHLGGIEKASKILPKLHDRIKVKIGLFCGRSSTRKFLEILVAARGRKMQDLIKVNFRAGNWWNFGYELIFKDGIEFYQLGGTKTGLLRMIWNNYICMPRLCAYCHDPLAFESDISAGDAWLPQFMGNKDGINLVITRSRVGLDIVENASMMGIINITQVPDAHVRAAQGGQINKKTHGLLQNVVAAKRLNMWLAPELKEWINNYEFHINNGNLIRHALRPQIDRVAIFHSHLPKGEKLCEEIVKYLNR